MDHSLDPRVKRFLEHHSVSPIEEVERDVRETRDWSPAQRWECLERLSGTLSWLASRPMSHQARVLEWRDSPHPTYREIVARLRREGRGS